MAWIILAVSGLIQAWFTRHRIAPDGISYLDIAKNYVKGDWHAALNGYWSPLYSWLLAALMICLRPSSYWGIGLLHLVNYCAYLAALIGFELWLQALLRFQRTVAGSEGMSGQTMHVAGYSAFLVASLFLIGIGADSPDMVGTAIGMFLAYFVVQFVSGAAKTSTCIWFGILLGLEYLARAAFAPFIVVYVCVAAILLRQQKTALLRPIAYVAISTALTVLPFVSALSASKGYLTLGEAGKVNYGWEVCGAARSTHWQGEPYDIGKPLHPTHKVLDHPATYTFASPVAGSYPPWYDPSYWYAGIHPRLKLKPQLKILFGSLKLVTYLFIRSPIVIPVIALIVLMGWRRWLSKHGILVYWFLWAPAVIYIAMYMLVYLDSRYIAGPLVVIWICLLASIRIPNAGIRWKANTMLQVFSLIFGIGFLFTGLRYPALRAASDLLHHHEAEWNLNWMIASRFQQIGLQSGNRIAWIGLAMDAEWPSIVGVRIVAEVPVISEHDNTLMHRAHANRKEIEAFWRASPEQKARVLEAFRSAGATIVIVDEVPAGVDSTGWYRVLPKNTAHLPWSGGQIEWQKNIAFMRLLSR